MTPVDRSAIRDLLAPCHAAMAEVRDTTFVLRRREWVRGRMLPLEEIEVRWRAHGPAPREPERDGDLLLTWVGRVYKGRKALWRPGKDSGKMRVKAGRLIPTIKLDPLGTMAMRESRSPVWMASVMAVQKTILDQDAYIDGRPELGCAFFDLGTRQVGGAPARGYKAKLPKDQDSQLYGHEVEVWFSTDTHVLAAVQVWDREDGEIVQVEDHVFADLRVNTGLTERDFEPRRVGL